MRKRILVLSAALMMLLSCAAHAEGKTLAVSGSATVKLKADLCTVQMGVETEAADVSEAQQENARITAQVLEALKALGAGDEDLVTGNYNIYTNMRYESGPDGSERYVTSYHVSNILSVTIRNIDDAGAWIDAGVAAGANQLYGLTYLSENTAAAYDQALTLACADAAHKAQVLADACSVTLGEILEITLPESGIVSYGRNAEFEETALAKDAGAGTSLQAGDMTVTARVTILWEIQ